MPHLLKSNLLFNHCQHGAREGTYKQASWLSPSVSSLFRVVLCPFHQHKGWQWEPEESFSVLVTFLIWKRMAPNTCGYFTFCSKTIEASLTKAGWIINCTFWKTTSISNVTHQAKRFPEMRGFDAALSSCPKRWVNLAQKGLILKTKCCQTSQIERQRLGENDHNFLHNRGCGQTP